MSEPKRYEYVSDGYTALFINPQTGHAAPKGKYVGLDDYAKVKEAGQNMLQHLRESTSEVERLKSEVERLTKWQPIETAPRDGTEIIGRAGLWVEVTAFFKGTKPWERKEAWVTSNDDEGYAQDFKPTHWLPLPEIPAKEGKKSNG